jgi:hypothetical protein
MHISLDFFGVAFSAKEPISSSDADVALQQRKAILV